MMKRADPRWLDAQYNNRARIPDHPQIFARWQADSERARASSRARLGLSFGDAPGDRLDLFLPAASGAPVMVFIHGGYWRALSRSDHSFVAPPFVQAGAMVVVPDYDLCPAVSIEHIAQQTARALAWVWRHAAAYGGDPHRLVVVGHSAGGHLAAMMLCCRWAQVGTDLPSHLVHAAVGLSGLYDLEPIRRTPFLQVDLRLTPAAVRRLSPAGFPAPPRPLYALVGELESEEFLRQNQLIRDRWGAPAVPVCATVGGRHHLDILDALTDPSDAAHRHVLQALGLGST